MTDNQVTYKLGRQVIKLLINSQPLYSDRYCLDRFNVVTDCHLSVLEENLVSSLDRYGDISTGNQRHITKIPR